METKTLELAKLISFVKANPILWKLDMKNSHMNQTVWNNIGTVLGKSGFEAEREWNILKTHFQREYLIRLSDPYSPKKWTWTFYDDMLFLKDSITSSPELEENENPEINSTYKEFLSTKRNKTLKTKSTNTSDEELSNKKIKPSDSSSSKQYLKPSPLKLKLIEIVEKHPILWNVYKKGALRRQAVWENVAVELGISGLEARRQWDILRDQFRREHKKYLEDNNFKTKWFYYEKMIFLVNALKIQLNKNNDNEGKSKHEKVGTRNDEDFVCISDDSENISHANFHNGTFDEFYISDMSSSVNQYPEYNEINIKDEICISNASSPVEQCSDIPTNENDSINEIAPCNQNFECIQKDSENCSSIQMTTEDAYDVDINDEDEDHQFVMSLLPSLRCLKYPNKLNIRSKILDAIAREIENSFSFQTASQSSVKLEIV